MIKIFCDICNIECTEYNFHPDSFYKENFCSTCSTILSIIDMKKIRKKAVMDFLETDEKQRIAT